MAKTQHALATQLTERFGEASFNIVFNDPEVLVRWIDGPSAVQVGEYLTDCSFPEDITEDHQVIPQRSYSSSALKAGLQKVGRETTLPATTPRIQPCEDGFGAHIKSALEVEIRGKTLVLPLAVQMLLHDEDMTVVSQVKAYEYSTEFKGLFSVGYTRPNGREIKVTMGPDKVQMMLDSVPEMQQYLKDVTSGKVQLRS